MATADTVLLTADEFWDWCQRPENADRRCELVLGEIVDLASPGEMHGVICAWIVFLLLTYTRQRGIGRVMSNDTGLIVSRGPDSVRGADVMLFTKLKPFVKLSRRYPEQVPELVVEVLSPTDRDKQVLQKIEQYLKAGVKLVWLVDPELRIVTVYQKDHEPRTLDESDELSDPEILPDFTCQVAELFGNAEDEAE